MKSVASRLASWSGTLVIGSLTFLGLPSLALAEASPGPWTPLFNGKDFTGWVVPAGRGAAPNTPPQNPLDMGWKIEDGAIVGGQVPVAPCRRIRRIQRFRQVPQRARAGVVASGRVSAI